MAAFVAEAFRWTVRRLLYLSVVFLLASLRARTNDSEGLAAPQEGEEVGLIPDSTTAMADATPASVNELPQGESSVLDRGGHNRTGAGAGESPADLQAILCPSGLECSKLGGECIDCDFNPDCVYGQETSVHCRAKPQVNCTGGGGAFTVPVVCRYCYQVEAWEQTCQPLDRRHKCKVVSNPREKERYKSNCTVRSHVVCLGHRTFPRWLLCNWTAGYKWTTALVLSVTLGGFGADRFYLGHWQEGIGKLFSFGGLGVWTLLDVVLIAVGYLGPADGSLYIW